MGAARRTSLFPQAAGGMRQPYDPNAPMQIDDSGNEHTANNVYMNGAEIFAFTPREVPAVISRVLSANGLSVDDVDLFVPHQANAFILAHLQRKLRIPPERIRHPHGGLRQHRLVDDRDRATPGDGAGRDPRRHARDARRLRSRLLLGHHAARMDLRFEWQSAGQYWFEPSQAHRIREFRVPIFDLPRFFFLSHCRSLKLKINEGRRTGCGK